MPRHGRSPSHHCGTHALRGIRSPHRCPSDTLRQALGRPGTTIWHPGLPLRAMLAVIGDPASGVPPAGWVSALAEERSPRRTRARSRSPVSQQPSLWLRGGWKLTGTSIVKKGRRYYFLAYMGPRSPQPTPPAVQVARWFRPVPRGSSVPGDPGAPSRVFSRARGLWQDTAPHRRLSRPVACEPRQCQAARREDHRLVPAGDPCASQADSPAFTLATYVHGVLESQRRAAVASSTFLVPSRGSAR